MSVSDHVAEKPFGTEPENRNIYIVFSLEKSKLAFF